MFNYNNRKWEFSLYIFILFECTIILYESVINYNYN